MTANVSATANTNLKTYMQMQGAGFQPTGTPVTVPVFSYNSPASQNLTLQNPNSLERVPKNDTVTIFGKQLNKKKALVFTGLTVATAATVATSVFLAIRSRNTATVLGANAPHVSNLPLSELFQTEEKIDSEAVESGFRTIVDNLTKMAKELAVEAQKKVDAVIDTYHNKGMDAEGKIVADIFSTSERSTEQTMVEKFLSSPITDRRSIFVEGIPQIIIETLENGEKNIIRLEESGKVALYQRGVSGIGEGENNIVEQIALRQGNLGVYAKKIKMLLDKKQTVTTECQLEFYDNKPYILMENIKKHLANSSMFVERSTCFDESGAPESIIMGAKDISTNTPIITSNYYHNNDKWIDFSS